MVHRPRSGNNHRVVSHDLPALIFDLGGVLLDWRPQDFVRDLIPGASLDDVQLQSLMGCVFQRYNDASDWVAFDLNQIDLKTLSERIAARTLQERSLPALQASQIRSWIDSLAERLQVLEASLEWLGALRAQKHDLYFLSNMPRLFIASITRHRRLFDCFRDGIFSGDVNIAKPDQAIFKLAQERFFGQALQGAHPRDAVNLPTIIFFDDHPVNVQSARAFGWEAILFSDVEQAKRDFETGYA